MKSSINMFNTDPEYCQHSIGNEHDSTDYTYKCICVAQTQNCLFSELNNYQFHIHVPLRTKHWDFSESNM